MNPGKGEMFQCVFFFYATHFFACKFFSSSKILYLYRAHGCSVSFHVTHFFACKIFLSYRILFLRHTFSMMLSFCKVHLIRQYCTFFSWTQFNQLNFISINNLFSRSLHCIKALYIGRAGQCGHA